MKNPDVAHATPTIPHKRLKGSPSQETPTARNLHYAMKDSRPGQRMGLVLCTPRCVCVWQRYGRRIGIGWIVFAILPRAYA